MLRMYWASLWKQNSGLLHLLCWPFSWSGIWGIFPDSSVPRKSGVSSQVAVEASPEAVAESPVTPGGESSLLAGADGISRALVGFISFWSTSPRDWMKRALEKLGKPCFTLTIQNIFDFWFLVCASDAALLWHCQISAFFWASSIFPCLRRFLYCWSFLHIAAPHLCLFWYVTFSLPRAEHWNTSL